MWLSTRIAAVAALALAAGGAAAAGGSLEVTAVVALSRADGALRPDVAPCTFVYLAPAASDGNTTRNERREYAYSLGRGGLHDVGFSAPFLRADVPGNVAATGDAGEAGGGEPSRFFYQVRVVEL
jgi:hypothetical protein